jgi:hypothetical protein
MEGAEPNYDAVDLGGIEEWDARVDCNIDLGTPTTDFRSADSSGTGNGFSRNKCSVGAKGVLEEGKSVGA